jgi:oligopeptide/dipeptide ABC transporter ATP-binding protein
MNRSADRAVEGPLLRVGDLIKDYQVSSDRWRRRGLLRAVDGVSFDVMPGEVLGLVGESGCGKSTVAASILRLVDVTSGTVMFDGTDVLNADRNELRLLRKRMQIVFQNPAGAFDPRQPIGISVAEGLRVQGISRGPAARSLVSEILADVGLSDEHLDRHPAELSGGQLQRAGIARALILDPDLLICDEAVSALDVSVQAQVINLLIDLQAQRHLAMIFISHDLAVVGHIADRVVVMYLGKIVESGQTDEVFADPSHPYTRALLAAVPKRRHDRERIVLKDEAGSTQEQSATGCNFAPHCQLAISDCLTTTPQLREVAAGHWSACLHNE